MALVFKAKNILLSQILWPLRCPQWLHCHRPRQQQPWEQPAPLLLPPLLPSLLLGPLLLPLLTFRFLQLLAPGLQLLLTFRFLQLLAPGLQLLLHQKKWSVWLIHVPVWGKGLKTCMYIGRFFS